MPNCSLLSKSLLLATETDFWQPNGPHHYAPTLRKEYQHNFQLLDLFEIWAAPRPPADSIVLVAFSRMGDRCSQAIGGDHYQTALTHWPETCLYSGDKMATRRPAQWLGRKTEPCENILGSVSLEMHIRPQPNRPLQASHKSPTSSSLQNWLPIRCLSARQFISFSPTLTWQALHAFKQILRMQDQILQNLYKS